MWFIFWLLNFSILYAVIAQVMPVIRFKMPNPMLLTVVGGFVLGVVYHALDMTALGNPRGLANMFWVMIHWTLGISIYVPFFAAGVIGGRNGWLESIESMSRWCKWTLRVIVGVLLLLLLLDKFQVLPWNPKGLGWLWDGLLHGVYPVGITLMQMQLFHEILNINTKFLGAVGMAAYTVYIIHPWVITIFMLVFVEILKAAHVPIVFAQSILGAIISFQTTDAAGKPASLGEGTLLGGMAMVLVLTQLTVWPAAYYLRKLPVLNKML